MAGGSDSIGQRRGHHRHQGLRVPARERTTPEVRVRVLTVSFISPFKSEYPFRVEPRIVDDFRDLMGGVIAKEGMPRTVS